MRRWFIGVGGVLWTLFGLWCVMDDARALPGVPTRHDCHVRRDCHSPGQDADSTGMIRPQPIDTGKRLEAR